MRQRAFCHLCHVIRTLATIATVSLGAIVPSDASAQVWTTSPTGSFTYTTPYFTSASFRCTDTGTYFPGMTCLGEGSALTLAFGGETMTFSFTPASGSVTLPHGSALFPGPSLGTVTVAFTGTEPFSFPPVRHAFARYGWIDLFLHVPGQGGVEQVRRAPYAIQPAGKALPGVEGVRLTACFIYRTCELAFPIDPTPNGYAQSIVWRARSTGLIPAGNVQITLPSGAVFLTPEPATVALTAGGLLVLAAAARTRRG